VGSAASMGGDNGIRYGLDERRAMLWGTGGGVGVPSHMPSTSEEDGDSVEARARNAAVRALCMCCFQHGVGDGHESSAIGVGPGAELPYELA